MVVLAILLSCILKKVDEEDEEDPDNAIAQTDEELEDPVLVNGRHLICLINFLRELWEWEPRSNTLKFLSSYIKLHQF